MFTATKRELGELYTLFRLLADGAVSLGTPEAVKDHTLAPWRIAFIQREEHDGTRRYYIEEGTIRLVSGALDNNEQFVPADGMEEGRFPQSDFVDAADYILHLLHTSTGNEVEVPSALEGFLDALNIQNLEAITQDRTDLSIAFWSVDAPLEGFTIACSLAPMTPLLDGGRTANIKLAQLGIKFPNPTINKINAYMADSDNEVAERINMIQRLGGILKYDDVADRVFRSNLMMIDLHFPRLFAEMIRTMYMEGISRVDELTQYMNIINPLKIKQELIDKHNFYSHKVKQFLMALALGMRPAKIYKGTDSKIKGLIFCNNPGHLLLFSRYRTQVFEEFIYNNAKLKKGSTQKDKFGTIEKENGTCHFKINAKIIWNKI